MTKILIAVLVFFWLSVLAFNLLQGNQLEKFKANAVKITGRIERKEELDSGQKNRRKEYWVFYSYTDSQGALHHAQEQVEYPDIWASLKESYPAEMYISRDNSNISHLAVLLDRRLGIAQNLHK